MFLCVQLLIMGLKRTYLDDFSPNKSGFNSGNMAWLLAPTLTHFLVVMTEQNLHFLKRVSCLVHTHPIPYHHEYTVGKLGLKRNIFPRFSL